MQFKEARDILISAVVIAFVFSYEGFDFTKLLYNFPIALLVVSLGFVLHEMGHRYYAKKYKCHAEYQIWWFGLGIAMLLAVATNGGFVFAAPGAVMIYPLVDLWGRPMELTRKNIGIISLAGPAINIFLAAIFLVLNFAAPSDIFSIGARINIWLALFNMLPIPPLDGSKILAWDKKVWIAMFAGLIVLFLVMMFFI
jgi:Zn-dependent protease